MMEQCQWCSVCANNGTQSKLQLFQINLEEAVLLCTQPECTYPIGAKETSEVVVKRDASLATSRKKKKPKNRRRSEAAVVSSSNPLQDVPKKELPSGLHQEGPQPTLGAACPPGEPATDSSVGQQSSIEQFGSSVSAFKPYSDISDHGDMLDLFNPALCNALDQLDPPSTQSQPPQLACDDVAMAIPSAPASMALDEDVDLCELLSNLQEHELDDGKNQELDLKLSDIFSDLESHPQVCGDQHADSGIFDVLTTSMTSEPDVLPPAFDQSDAALSYSIHHKSDELSPLPNLVSQSETVLQTNATSGSQSSSVIHVENQGKSDHLPETVCARSQSNSALHVKPDPDRVAVATEAEYLQWRNVDALCWLDVCLCLLVHSPGIAQLLSAISQAQHCALTTILQAYNKAQGLLHKATSIHELNLEEVGRALKLETSIGRVGVRTGGGQIGDLGLPLLPPCESEPKILTASEEAMSCLRQAGRVLNEVRENIWAYLCPKLKCVRGKNDSPVFALPLLLGNHPEVEAAFRVQYLWRMVCDVCGYDHREHVEKVLPTFPQVPPDFNMEHPCFLRPCVKCQAPEQRMNMVLQDRLPKVLIVHFVEGLWRANLTDYDFTHQGQHYAVSGVVQYREKPSHFVAWIRDVHNNRWMECDDMKTPVCQFTDVAPRFPPSQVHMLMWESSSSPQTPGKGGASSPDVKMPLTPLSALQSPLVQSVCDLTIDSPTTPHRPDVRKSNVLTTGSDVTSVAHSTAPVTMTTWSTHSDPCVQDRLATAVQHGPSVAMARPAAHKKMPDPTWGTVPGKQTMHSPVSMATTAPVTMATPELVPIATTALVTMATPGPVPIAMTAPVTMATPELVPIAMTAPVTMATPEPFPIATTAPVTMATPAAWKKMLKLEVPAPVTMATPTPVTKATPSHVTKATPAARKKMPKLEVPATPLVPPRRVGNLLAVQAAWSETETPGDRVERMRQRFLQVKSTNLSANLGASKKQTRRGKAVGSPRAIIQQSEGELKNYVKNRYSLQNSGKQVFAGYMSSRSSVPACPAPVPASIKTETVSLKRKSETVNEIPAKKKCVVPERLRTTGYGQMKQCSQSVLTHTVQQLQQFSGTIVDSNLWPGKSFTTVPEVKPAVTDVKLGVPGIKPLPVVSSATCVATTGVVSSGVATPGVATPGVATPGVATPGVATPGVVSQGVATPGVVSQGVATPGAVSSGVAISGVATCGVATGVVSQGVVSPVVTVPEQTSQSSVGFSACPPPVCRVANLDAQQLPGFAPQDVGKEPVLRLEVSTAHGRQTITVKRPSGDAQDLSDEGLKAILQQICSSLSGPGTSPQPGDAGGQRTNQ